jgi:hypothetical protein
MKRRPLLALIAAAPAAGCVSMDQQAPVWVCTANETAGELRAASTRFLRRDGSALSETHEWSWETAHQDFTVKVGRHRSGMPGAADTVLIVVEVGGAARQRSAAAGLAVDGTPFRPEDPRFRDSSPASGFTLWPPLETLALLDAARRPLEILITDAHNAIVARIPLEPDLFARAGDMLDQAMLHTEQMAHSFESRCRWQPTDERVFIA